ncbi:hypothetical protein [Paenibacillus macquariensis]|uniref:Uncharacterized protein n=1 Tax=Paenibacillus macquariensis TaxID=948756 RepID=A0ABY1K1A1_9BACL|nr:hypothetical protein [Paenibacillus macquariensis]MEC0091806.1 hypothetical protein [Paenibacillus macquariensis]OAB32282.1 hypothetical protein PMSM_16875 [Paenibacillus macquariensis subsp. macquariensis]SIR11624.1 hypothetical protein SAMN05421578_107109 [Paenibacillus macquariensis]
MTITIKNTKKIGFTFVPVFNPLPEKYINNDEPLKKVIEIILGEMKIPSMQLSSFNPTDDA